MEISIQCHVMLIRQSSDQILMRCYIKYFIESDKRFNFCQILTHNIIFNVLFLNNKAK